MPSIHWLAVAAAALSSFVLGGLWYGPLFGQAWRRATGISAAAEASNPGLVFASSCALQLVAATLLAAFVGDPGMSFTAVVAAAAAVGVGWVATALGVICLFERRSLAYWAVNAGYQIVAFTLMGVILGAWR